MERFSSHLFISYFLNFFLGAAFVSLDGNDSLTLATALPTRSLEHQFRPVEVCLW
jgi:hypothetical protein